MKAGLEYEFISTVLLAGLSDEYNSLLMNLKHSAAKLSTKIVVVALLKENMRESTNEDTMALVSRNDRNSKMYVICHWCKKNVSVSRPKEQEEG